MKTWKHIIYFTFDMVLDYLVGGTIKSGLYKRVLYNTGIIQERHTSNRRPKLSKSER